MSSVEKETVRYFSEEQIIDFNVNFPLTYTTGVVNTWGGPWFTFANILVVTKPSILVFRVEFDLANATDGGLRVAIVDSGGNAYYVGGRVASGSGSYEFRGISYIFADTWDIRIDAINSAAGNNVTNITWYMGITNFSDLTGQVVDRHVNENIINGGSETMFDINISNTIRQCVLGTVRRHVIRVQAFIRDSAELERGEWSSAAPAVDYAGAIFRSVGGVTQDTVPNSPTPYTEYEDVSVNINACNYLEHAFVVDVEEVNRIILVIQNNAGVARNFDAYWSVVACPWFGDDNFYADPVLISLPSGSTINLTNEPLDEDVTKYIGLGTQKALQEDYVYNEASGTDIITHSDSLNDLPTHGLSLFHRAFRAAVTVIAADRRG